MNNCINQIFGTKSSEEKVIIFGRNSSGKKENKPADAAASAVKLLFVLIIVELAVEAEVLRVQDHEGQLKFVIISQKTKSKV